MREKPKIDIFVRRYNAIYRRVVSEYWGSTVKHHTCRSATLSIERDKPGPVGITAHKTDRVFARFDRRSR